MKVAAEKHVPLVHLNALSMRVVQELGPMAANNLAQMPPSADVAAAAASMGKVDRAFDYTHLGRDGADYFAKMVTDELAIQVPVLRQYLVP